MINYIALLSLLFIFLGCDQNWEKKKPIHTNDNDSPAKFYSNIVKDTFLIFVDLPNEYNQERKYPVVYLLDANLYFDIIATIIRKYSSVGLAPSVILVGVGYKDFQTMDSLRNRDYTYPTAIASYEMSTSGGADHFSTFIKTELIPIIDRKYNTDTTNRVLAGHSLGGYLSMYVLLQNLLGQSKNFNSYLIASPSIDYNNYWLLHQLKEVAAKESSDKKVKAYITFGGLEDAENTEDAEIKSVGETTALLSKLLSEKQFGYLDYKGETFSNLGHMDTQIPTFIKGLRWALNEDK